MATARTSWLIRSTSVMAVVLLAGCATNVGAPSVNLQEQVHSARTPADHLALSERYDREAVVARGKATEHDTMAKTYGPYPAGRSGFSVQAHCKDLVKTYDTLASQYEQLASYHRLLAEAAKPR